MTTLAVTIPAPDGFEAPEDIEGAVDRAERAVAVSQFNNLRLPDDLHAEDYEAAIGDLAANLLHLAEAEGFDPELILTHAAYHYGAGRQV